jgi:hypothetical protein
MAYQTLAQVDPDKAKIERLSALRDEKAPRREKAPVQGENIRVRKPFCKVLFPEPNPGIECDESVLT